MRIRWVKVWVDSLATLTERFRDEEGRVDFEAMGREEYAFRHALVTGDFSRSERARDLYDATINEITSRSEAGRKGAEARWKKDTAAATTSDGVDVVPNREGGLFARTTGCNNSGEGGTPGIERTSSPLPSPTPVKTDPKPTKKAKAEGKPEERKYPHGEFENIMLSTREYAKLCERLDNADSLIEEADGYFEAQPDKKRKYKSHYAMLLNWSRRKATEAKQPSRYKNINDINRENCEQIERDLRAMFHPEEVI